MEATISAPGPTVPIYAILVTPAAILKSRRRGEEVLSRRTSQSKDLEYSSPFWIDRLDTKKTGVGGSPENELVRCNLSIIHSLPSPPPKRNFLSLFFSGVDLCAMLTDSVLYAKKF